ncbi:MAG: divergent polysaccharide deacetylase family protein, partial [bacterium]|nr:divergent polysaccharide deacetylase family protein [bacterium]
MGRRRRRRSVNWRAIAILVLLIAAYSYFRANYEGVRLIPKKESGRVGHMRSSEKREGVSKRRGHPDINIKEEIKERFPFLSPKERSEDKEDKGDAERKKPPVKKESRHPSDRGSAIAAIVIDDFGYSDGRPFLEMDAPLTFAVLPGLPHSRSVSRQAARQGRDVLLHLPMEPKNGSLGFEKNTIKTAMTNREVEKRVEEALESVPEAIGVNNHMGSKATADPGTMTAVMRILADRGLFFLDSLTASDSVASSAAAGAGVVCLERDIFLDGSDDSD